MTIILSTLFGIWIAGISLFGPPLIEDLRDDPTTTFGGYTLAVIALIIWPILAMIYWVILSRAKG